MQLLESIQMKDGKYINLPLHQVRVDRAFERFAPSIESHDLEQILPNIDMKGIYKVRLVYDLDTEDAEYDLEYSEYHARKIETLEVIYSKPFDYSMKYADRSPINKLVKQSKADDIIIAIDGKIADGSYFNVVFWNGADWLTPDSYLLNGVRRQQLLNERKIKEATIRVEDLHRFEKVSLINAMLDLEQLELPVSAIALPKNDG
ncbi:aminotransferase class IV [Ekhidna sp. MALMAid0563]|uniref:aminotransferase class IV n=1 Tax=Ekhidna sp. MALMAid0563 TaxID=3143937 RepID=UPI0032DE71E1